MSVLSVYKGPALSERAIRANLDGMCVAATIRYDGRLGDKNKRLALTTQKGNDVIIGRAQLPAARAYAC